MAADLPLSTVHGGGKRRGAFAKDWCRRWRQPAGLQATHGHRRSEKMRARDGRA
jgi:hypothetical protein